jgi:hypothetical protein
MRSCLFFDLDAQIDQIVGGFDAADLNMFTLFLKRLVKGKVLNPFNHLNRQYKPGGLGITCQRGNFSDYYLGDKLHLVAHREVENDPIYKAVVSCVALGITSKNVVRRNKLTVVDIRRVFHSEDIDTIRNEVQAQAPQMLKDYLVRSA